jgi:uncharacterized Zn ribbon protein
MDRIAIIKDMIVYGKKRSIKDGDRITIAGIRWYKNGTFTSRCKKGKETVFIAKQRKILP